MSASFGDLPSLFFLSIICMWHLRATLWNKYLAAPSMSALDLLPPFYRSVMTSWFRLSPRIENSEIVIAGSDTSFFPLRSLSVSFVFQQLSHLDKTEHFCVAKYSSDATFSFRAADCLTCAIADPCGL